jgi:hypothetical protein
MQPNEVVIEAWHVRWRRRYSDSWAERYFRIMAPLSLLAFAASIIASFYAIGYATSAASNPVTDIVLSNVPIYNTDGLFVWGTALLIFFITVILMYYPRYIPFALFSLAAFWFIRSGFTILTHIAPYPVPTTETYDLGRLAGRFFFGGDRFFSGHTGAPFLFALIFWHRPLLRTMFLGWSIFFALVVLLGHLHYSIDVASAYFITYGIYQLCLKAFPQAYTLFRTAEPEVGLH